MIGERRTYTLRKRAQTAEETRLRIIEAARSLLSEAGYPKVSLDVLAARAGVSRQTIYVQFGSKGGVLQALAEHIELESYGTDILEGARTVADPVATIRNGITDQTRFHNRNAGLLRTFHAQAANDPDFRMVWDDRMQKRWEAINILVSRMEQQGQLAEGWTIEEATDWLWSLTNFRLYDEMVMQRGWDPERLIRRIVLSIDTLVLAGRVVEDLRRDCAK
jgi:AcrR family transcriptional regulator